MRVMVDANIIISAGLFPESSVGIIIETPKIMKPRKYIEEYIIKPTC